MRVKFDGHEYGVKSHDGNHVVLDNGNVASWIDCKIVDEKPKAEPKPKTKKKADKVG